MLHYPNSLYTGITAEMEKYWGFPCLHASPGNSRWAWPGGLLSFSLCQYRQELAYSSGRWAKVSVDNLSDQLL